jgi:hypothetical protein
LPVAILFTLLGLALFVMMVGLVRAGRQVAGGSAFKGAVFGVAWMVAFAGLGVTAGNVMEYLPPAQVGLLWAASSTGLVAVPYVAGAAIYSDRTMLALGCWLGVANVGGVLAGPGWHSLVIAVAGGGGALVFGYQAWLRISQAEQPVAPASPSD